MPDHMRNQLGAYLDGELDRRSHMEVQAHLETCQSCRNELEELRQLSHWLQAAPQPDFTPALDFKAQLMLQLPRRSEKQPQRSKNRPLFWLAPGLVLASWIFIQVTLGVSTLVLLANQVGLLGGAAAWAAGTPEQMQWFAIVQAMMGGTLNQEGLVGLEFLNSAGLFTQNMVILLLWQVVAAVFYWGALTLVWHTEVKPMWGSPSAG